MQHYPLTVENLLLTIVITSALVLIIMDLLNRFNAMFNSKEAAIAAKDVEIQNLNNTISSLNETIANLQNQLAQTNPQELSNFLSERGF